MRFFWGVVTLFLQFFFLLTPVYAQFDYTSAVSLSLNGSASGTMDHNHSNYWWKITTTVDGSLYINTLASSGLEIDNYIYDQNGITQLSRYDFGGSHPEDQTHFNNLTPGTYYIRSNNYYLLTGSYTITSTFTPTKFENDPEPNDSAAVAAILPLNESRTGHLRFYGNGKTDLVDWWKITTTVDGSLYINTLSDSTLEIDNYIFDQDGKTQIAKYDFGGTHPEDQSHVNNLAPGTYYIKTLGYNGYGSYTVTSTFTPTKFENDPEPNDSAAVAATLPLNGSRTGHLRFYRNGGTDSVDWWKIITTVDGSLYINTLSDSTLEIDNYIYDQDGKTQIASYDFGGSHPEDQTHFNNLAPGTYYIKTLGYNGYGSYTITSTSTLARFMADQEPNSNRETALSLYTGATRYGHLGYYSSGITDTADFYSFNVPSGWDSLFVRIVSDSLIDVDAIIYNSIGNEILHNGASGIHTVMAVSKPTAGKYFLNIYRSSGFGSYAFILSNTWQDSVKVEESSPSQLEPPTDFQVADIPNDQGHTLKLTWTLSASENSNSVDFYRIFRSRLGTFTNPIPVSRFATLDSINFYDLTYTILIDSVAAGVKEYIDYGVPMNGITYYYWLQAVGTGGVSKPIAAGFATTVQEIAPLEFKVSDAWPNPFNPTTTIRYELPESAHIKLTVYDVLGKKVAVLEDGVKSAGVHDAIWNARNRNGGTNGSGVYFWLLETGPHRAHGKMMLLR
jgi:hypothetical protein